MLILQADAGVLGGAVLTLDLDELTDYVVRAAGNDYRTAMSLMIECLQLVSNRLPSDGDFGLEAAKKFWIENSISAVDLEQARVACWNYLDERSASTDTSIPEYSAIRATICVLYADPPSDDIGELIAFFLEMVTGAAPEYVTKDFTAAILSCIRARTGKADNVSEDLS